jgi:putative tricarboxylic transport membrane protein
MTLLNRGSGLAITLAGLALLLFVIPDQVEVVDYGWVRPETVPNAMAVALIGLGLFQAILPTGGTSSWRMSPALRALGYLAVTALGVWAMGRFGFVAVAPVMVLVLMLLIGERRPFWLGLGVLAMPAVIWLTVTQLLDRTLPG